MKKRFLNKRILITGGLGFVGSNLAIAIVKEGGAVTILDSLISGLGGNMFNIESIKNDIRLSVSDMRDSDKLDELVKNQDFIFHLAGQVSHSDSMSNPQLDLDINCLSTVNLVDSCLKHNPGVRIIYTSTRQVYGVPIELPVTEKHPAFPVDVNGINKLAAENYHLLYDRVYNLRSVVIRLTNTYGPRQQIRNNKQVGIFIRQSLKGETINIFGDGKQLRDFNYIDDVISALMLSALTDDCYGKVFNIGAKDHCSILDFVEALSHSSGVNYKLMPFPESKKLIDIGDYYGDYSKFYNATSWHPSVDLEDGLKKTINFFKKNGEEYWK